MSILNFGMIKIVFPVYHKKHICLTKKLFANKFLS